MRWKATVSLASCLLLAGLQGTHASAPMQRVDPVKTLVDRLEIERYKATIKSLTQFGDRLDGTARNRAAVDWIEQQLRTYGCSDIVRFTYTVEPPRTTGAASAPIAAAFAEPDAAEMYAQARRVGGEIRAPSKVVNVEAFEPQNVASNIVILELLIAPQGNVAQVRVLKSVAGLNEFAVEAARQWVYAPTLVGGVATPVIYTVAVPFGSRPTTAAGTPTRASTTGAPLGAMTRRGARGAIMGANTNPGNQPSETLRTLNAEQTTPGPREQIYCTKVGSAHPDEMYILGAHIDGRGFGEAANDNASGTAIVMELARIFSSADVQTERSIRFAFWNTEEFGITGSNAYVRDRRDLQGKEDPPGSGRYPEPHWLGMIQHDMMLFDHGMPLADGTVNSAQRPEADVNIEFQENSRFAAESQALARRLQQANERYAKDYPAAIGGHMANTDSGRFQDAVAAVSVRENESIVQINNGWDPHHHQPTDLYATFSDNDFRLGLNAAQTSLGAVADLAAATLVR